MALLTNSKNEWIRLLLSAEAYKPGKGAIARNGTFAVVVGMIVWGMYSFSQLQTDPTLKWGLPAAVGGVLAWVAYRLIHYPRFADFLINTEAEINKVTWPTWQELKVSTGVVVTMILLMAVFLFLTDTFWKWFLTVLGVLKIGGLFGGGGAGM